MDWGNLFLFLIAFWLGATFEDSRLGHWKKDTQPGPNLNELGGPPL